jgi:hypothetical protein
MAECTTIRISTYTMPKLKPGKTGHVGLWIDINGYCPVPIVGTSSSTFLKSVTSTIQIHPRRMASLLIWHHVDGV